MKLLLVFTVSFACCLHAAEGPVLSIESPRELQVFQRRTKDEGSVKLSGTAISDVRYRIKGDWQDIAVDPKTHRFDASISVPSGGWYKLEMESSDGAKASVAQFGVGEIFVVAGQSNAGNYGSEKQMTLTRLVSSFDGTRWSIANDPQPGAGGKGGSFMPAFGDAMARRFGVPVGLIPVAAGGTSVREWLPQGIRFKQNTTTGKGVIPTGDEYESTGALFDKLTTPMRALGKTGFRAVLWHQGESDAGQARSGYPADRQISGAEYGEFMEHLIRRSRDVATWPVPWFTAITTYHSEADASDDEFRQAMRGVWAEGLSWPGPDTDSLRGDLRAGVHFNGKGLQKHGEMWAEQVGVWLDRELARPRVRE